MNRLLVNPGTAYTWEIQLNPGANLLGRSAANDFRIEDASVSGTHCRIDVADGAVRLTDLGSTNGTFVNRSPVQEATLVNGQVIQLGGVEMAFYSDATAPVHAATAPPAALRVRLASASPPPAEAPPAPPPIETSPTAFIQAGPRFCKFHPKSPARYLCNKCNRTFCELCITARTSGGVTHKVCRSCGVECVPLQVTLKRSAERGFFAKLPGAFIYPFLGMGVLILVCAAAAFAALGFISAGLLSIFGKVVFYGFLFLFMQNIIHTTASDESESLGFPSTGGLFGAALELAGTIAVSFGLALGLLAARLFLDVDIPVAAIMAAVVLGCFYFPMAFLAVAMKDSILAANPLVVFPAIFRIPFQYLVTALLLVAVFGFRQLGTLLSTYAGSVTLETRDMSVLFTAIGVQAILAFINVYLLTVTMRILGLLYNANKEKLGWF
jgi:hypothetical protein